MRMRVHRRAAHRTTAPIIVSPDAQPAFTSAAAAGERPLFLSSFSSPFCCASFARATCRASTSRRRERPSPSAPPTSRCSRPPCSPRCGSERGGHCPRRGCWRAAAAFALLIVVSSIPNGAAAVTAAGKLAELAALTLGAAAFLDTRERLGALAELIVAFTVVAVFWGAIGFVGAGGRQGSFLGEHDLAAVSTMALAVGLARLHAAAGGLGLGSNARPRGGRARHSRSAPRSRA